MIHILLAQSHKFKTPEQKEGFRDSLTSKPVFVYTNALLATENGTFNFEDSTDVTEECRDLKRCLRVTRLHTRMG